MVLRGWPGRRESLIAPSAEHQRCRVFELLALEGVGIGIEVDVLEHPATCAVLLTWTASWRVHYAVEGGKGGVDDVTHDSASPHWEATQVAGLMGVRPAAQRRVTMRATAASMLGIGHRSRLVQKRR